MHTASKRTLMAALVIGFALMAGGCLDANTALSDPEKAKADEAILGVWQSTDNPNQYLFIAKSGVSNAPVGIMHIVEAGYAKSDRTISAHQSYDFSITPVAGTNIVNLFIGSPRPGDLSYADWVKDDGKACRIVRYDVSGNKLSLWVEANSDAEDKAVKAGKIRHVKPDSSMEDAGSVLDYLKNGGMAAMFPDKDAITYTRATK